MYCDTTSRMTCSRVERLSDLLAVAVFARRFDTGLKRVKSKPAVLKLGPARENLERGRRGVGESPALFRAEKTRRLRPVARICHNSSSPAAANRSADDVLLSCTLLRCRQNRKFCARGILLSRPGSPPGSSVRRITPCLARFRVAGFVSKSLAHVQSRESTNRLKKRHVEK